MATPVLHALRNANPASRITAVIDADIQKVLQGSPAPDRLIPYSRKRSGAKAAAEFFRCTSSVRNERSDLALLLPNSFSSALMMRLAGIPERIGYRRDMRGPLLTRPLPRPADESGRFVPSYMAGYYLKLAEAAGAESTDIHPRLAFTDADMKSAEKILRRSGMDPHAVFFAIHPHAGYGPSKLWPEKHFSALAAMLHEEFGAHIAFIGSPAATGIVRRIRDAPPAAGLPTFDLTRCGIDLHLLKCVIRRCRLLVSTDSGPRHYGVALDVPTVCITGPTNPAYTDSGLPHDAVVRIDTDCGPCQEKNCRTDHGCMRRISPGMVLSRCKQLLDEEHEQQIPRNEHG